MRRSLQTMLSAAAILAFAGQASAQNALGDGRKNDRSIEQGSGGVNRPVTNDLQQNYALRNSIVTGNAPGGLSFRGNVGYVSSREFRGELGSDDLFSFRRDSLYSGISGLGLRGTDSLQYQFALTTGAEPPRSISGSLAISRDAFMPTVGPEVDRGLVQGRGDTTVPIRRVDAAQRLEEQASLAGNGLWKLRSTSGYLTDKSLATSYVGSIETGEGGLLDVTASPLGGLRMTNMQENEPAVSPRAQSSRVATNANSGRRVETNSPTTGAGEGLRLTTAYDQIVYQLAGRAPEGEGEGRQENPMVARVREQNEIIRAYIEGVTRTAAATEVPATPDAETGTPDGGPGLPDGGPPGLNEPGGQEPIEDENLTPRERMFRELERMNVDAAMIRAMRENEVMVDEMVAGAAPADRDFFSIYMQNGRRSMERGNYFDAESSFSRALSIRPGDPSASIARVHAQIGAGLFVAAATNLRDTLTRQPAMSTARYAPGLIPSDTRLRENAEKLELLIEREDLGARQAALVLAYIGYHLNDDELVREGLDRLDRDGEDRLSTLLRLMWVSDASPAGEDD